MKLKNNFTCPECGSNQTYHRVKTDDKRCLRCGCVWKTEKKKEKEGGAA